MMTIDEMIEVLQAARDGKKIQKRAYQGFGISGNKPYTDIDMLFWDFIKYDYRVRPEPKAIFIPFTDDDSEKFMGKKIIDRRTDNRLNVLEIKSFNKEGVYVSELFYSTNLFYSYKTLCKRFLFIDESNFNLTFSNIKSVGKEEGE